MNEVWEKKNNTIFQNLFAYKNERYFGYKPLAKEDAPYGTIGLPRVLNMYEDYPLWFTFFTELGFSVVLSPASSRKIYEMGIESIPSESECYPAKLAHGHVEWLIRQNVGPDFLSCIPYERNGISDAKQSHNRLDCHSYAENIKNNMDEIVQGHVDFMNPFLALTTEEIMADRLVEIFREKFQIPEEKSRRRPQRLGRAGKPAGVIFEKKENPVYLDQTDATVLSWHDGHTTMTLRSTTKFRSLLLLTESRS